MKPNLIITSSLKVFLISAIKDFPHSRDLGTILSQVKIFVLEILASLALVNWRPLPIYRHLRLTQKLSSPNAIYINNVVHVSHEKENKTLR